MLSGGGGGPKHRPTSSESCKSKMESSIITDNTGKADLFSVHCVQDQHTKNRLKYHIKTVYFTKFNILLNCVSIFSRADESVSVSHLPKGVYVSCI